jgi:hypothetical protein
MVSQVKDPGPSKIMDLIIASLLREHPGMPDEQVLSLAHGIYMHLAERVAAFAAAIETSSGDERPIDYILAM